MSGRPPVTADELARIRGMRAAGARITDIVAATGRHRSTVFRALRDERAVRAAERADRRAKRAAGRLECVRALVREGRGTVAAVSSDLACGHDTASALLRAAGCAPRTRRELTTDELRRIRELRQAGLGAKRIARQVGRQKGRVQKIIGRIEAGLLALGLALFGSHGTARAHDVFDGLRSPKGQLCCGGRDCKPVGECVLPDKRQGLLIEGECVPIPPDSLIGMASPDGQAHACYGYLGGHPQVRCAILPGDV